MDKTSFKPTFLDRKGFLSVNFHEVAGVAFIRYTEFFFAMLGLELGSKNSPVCFLFPFAK